MPLVEINFDGIVGPSHNFAGLSLGNLAAAANAGRASSPRAAALEGLAKMRSNMTLGLVQGILLPHHRPNRDWLADLGITPKMADDRLLANAMSASAMWAANAATVSPAADCRDRLCHLTVANLVTMPHRSHEWPGTLAQLRVAFADPAFVVHSPVPPPFGDEGAANHMRFADGHDAPGVEVFVYGESAGSFPVRQQLAASRAVAWRHGLDRERTVFVRQSDEAIAAGAFHNDVVAVSNNRVLFTHEQAFADPARFYADLRRLMPEVEIVEVPASAISLSDAIASYLFNAQLVTLPSGESTLILPAETQANPHVWSWLQAHLASNGPIRRLEIVDVRESMANGGGPACLRLRVVADPETVDSRFMMDEAKLRRIEALVAEWWPDRIEPSELADPVLWQRVEGARAALLELLDLGQLL